MFVKTLILNGFKGFKEKTTFHFQSGLGAIVGPNGCGKSNIIDALKWVWGEQKISELRGEKLDDLIFNGSKDFKPSNFCEVEIILDNQNKVFPLDYVEISILRRVYRSGETENFINQKSCRLKDITELLTNTGIGRSNYSIIEQGKIDRLFSDKVENRRALFEESAFLTNYKFKRKEYELKIRQTKDNLTRVEDILKIKIKQQEQLKQQAQKSEIYFQKEEKIKENNQKLFSHSFFVLAKRMKENENGLKEINFQLDKSKEAIQKQEENLQEMNSALESAEEKKNQIEKQIIQKEEKINSLAFEISYLNDNLSQLNNDFFDQEQNAKQFLQDKEEINRIILANEKQILKQEEKFIKIKKKQKQFQEDKKSLENNTLLFKKKNEAAQKKILTTKKEFEKTDEAEKEIDKLLIAEIDELKEKLEEKNYLNNFAALKESKKKFIEQFQQKNFTEATTAFSSFEKAFNDFMANEKLLYSFFFSTTGTYSKKNKIQNESNLLREEISSLEKALSKLVKEAEKNNEKILSINEAINNLEIDKVKLDENLKTLNNENALKKEQLTNLKKYHNTIIQNKKNLQEKKEFFTKEKSKKKSTINLIKQELKKIESELKQFSKSHQKGSAKKVLLAKTIHKAKAESDLLKIKMQKLNLESEINEKEKISLLDRLSYELELSLEDLKLQLLSKEKIQQLKEKNNALKKEMQGLGQVNLLARTEYQEIKKETDDLIQQKTDIEKSMTNLEEVASKLLEKTQKVFLDTLKKTNINFNKVIKKLFQGKGSIALENPENPLTSDIHITVEPNGKKPQKISLFSGGEKSLISFGVMFSLFLNNPSPICLLDEIDAALDYKNIERLTNLLGEMKQKSQILLISHNQKTMNIIDYLYGVSMQDGVSKLFSLKLEN